MKHNLELDGLRGLAALNVAIFHFLLAFSPAVVFSILQNSGTSNVFLKPILLALSVFINGNVAVLVFFVLSGYVLSMPYYNNDKASLVLKKRLWVRYLRLTIPIVFACLISYSLYKLNLYFNIDATKNLDSAAFFSYFNHPITFSTALEVMTYKSILFGDMTLVPPLWTLNIEFIGSIYLLLYYLSKPKKLTAISSSLLFLCLYIIHQASSIYFIAIFLGSFLNLVKISPRFKLPTLFIGFYFSAFQSNCVLYDFLPAIAWNNVGFFEIDIFYNTIGALLITASVANGIGQAFLRLKIVQFLGRISFSLYILHFSILCSFSCYFYVTHSQTNILLFINFLIFITICLSASALFEKYVDRPAVRLTHKISTFMSIEEEKLLEKNE